MKREITYRHCEYCNQAWEDTSPPTEEAYKNGLISIRETGMSVLRPKPIKKSHAKIVEGIFCNFDYLSKYFKKHNLLPERR